MTGQAQHVAQLHPQLHRALAPAMAATGAYYHSTWRPQIDCSRHAGPCSPTSKHSLPGGIAEAADLDAPGVSKADVGFWRGVASRVTDPCVEWGGPADANHFELQWDRCGGPSPLRPRQLAAIVVGLAVVLGLALS